MKKTLLSIVCAGAALSMCAQNASDGAWSSSGSNKAYNRIGISYDMEHFGPNKNMKDDMDGFSANGVGINYIHGFALSQSIPLYLETGINFNFLFHCEKGDKEDVGSYWMQEKQKFQDINLQVPVNISYRFNVGDDMYINPYLGINFKLHMATRTKWTIDHNIPDNILSAANIKSDDLEGDWESYFSEDDMGEDNTANRFQMGWQIGCGFQYKPLYIGLQWGTDFIPFYSQEWDKDKYKINTSNFKLTLAYNF